jgi:hypothetical protein
MAAICSLLIAEISPAKPEWQLSKMITVDLMRGCASLAKLKMSVSETG